MIVGASIHMGKYEVYVLDFVRENRDALERLPSAFFSVSMAAHDDLEEAEGYIEELVRETGWRERSALGVHQAPYHPYRQLHRPSLVQALPSYQRAPRLEVEGYGREQHLMPLTVRLPATDHNFAPPLPILLEEFHIRQQAAKP